MEEFQRLFGWADYLVFSLTLLISSVVGVYHACKSDNSTSDYLMGGKQMAMFPVAMSLAASAISATTLLGTPADVYLTGSMYWWIVIAAIIGICASTYLYLPIFFKLQVISVNQYLELRFNSCIRRMASLLYIIRQLFYLSIVVYGPSLALNQVTGIHVYISVSVLFVVCIFYTAVGGIKAVVWTDTIQIFVIYGSIIAVLIKGTVDLGGIGTIWQRNMESTRIDFFNIDIDPTTRHTVWGLLIGGYFYWTAWYATDQTTVQRFLVIPTLKKAQIAMLTNLICMGGMISFSCFAGLVIYAKYYDCDPLGAKIIQKADQIFPLYVMETVGNFPGLPGLFVAGIFSGALSSLSSGLNAVPLMILEDFVRPLYPDIEDQFATRISKFISLLFGCICFCLVFLVAQVQTILEATLSINGAVAGSMLGVFTLGMFNPWANAIGAGVGMSAAFTLMMILGVSTQVAKSKGFLHNQLKPLSTANCPNNINLTSLSPPSTLFPTLDQEINESFSILKISYIWYTLMGVLVVLILGTIVSFLTKPQDPRKLNPKLICNVGDAFSWILPSRGREYLRCSVGDDYEKDVPAEAMHEIPRPFSQ